MAKEPTEKAAEEKEAPKKTAAKKTTTKVAAKKTTKTTTKKTTTKVAAKKTTKTTTKKTTATTAAKKPVSKVTAKKEAPKKEPKAETPEVNTEEVVETPPVADTTVDVAVVEDKNEIKEDTQKAQAEFLDSFNWHNYEEGIDVIDDKQLDEFEKLVKENFVDTSDEDVIEGTVVYMTEREAIIDINASLKCNFTKRIPLHPDLK